MHNLGFLTIAISMHHFTCTYAGIAQVVVSQIAA